MTPALPDPPPGLDRLPRLAGPDGPLVRAGPAGRRPFTLSTPRVQVVGDERDGILRVDVARSGAARDVPLLGRVRMRGAGPPGSRTERNGPAPARAANVLVGPWSLRRELLLPGGTVLETILAPDRLPGVVVQWAFPAPPSGAVPNPPRLRLELPEAAGEVTSQGPLLRVDSPSGVTLVVLWPPPMEWRELPDLRWAGPLDRPLTLLAAGTTEPTAARTALASLVHLGALEARAKARASALLRPDGGGVVLRTGVAGLDESAAWARARLASAVRPDGSIRPGTTHVGDRTSPLGSPPLRWLWTAGGLLAAGEHALATAVVERGAPDGGAGELATLIARGWLTAWTGRPGFGRGGADVAAKRAARLAGRTTGRSSTDAVLARAALASMVDVLDAAGDRAGAAEVRAGLADPVPIRAAARGTDGPTAVALPVIGTEPGGGVDSASAAVLLALVLGVETETDPPVHPAPPSLVTAEGRDVPPLTAALGAWAAYRAARRGPPAPPDALDRAYALLRRQFSRTSGGAGETGPSGASGARFDDTALAALVPVGLVLGMLGAQPEADFGRLHLAPTLPPRWRSFALHGLRVGETGLSVRYAREGMAHTFVLGSSSGRVPLQLVFAPSVEGPVERVLVDGEPADVDRSSSGARTTIRLQLPIDRERSVSLVG